MQGREQMSESKRERAKRDWEDDCPDWQILYKNELVGIYLLECDCGCSEGFALKSDYKYQAFLNGRKDTDELLKEFKNK